MITLQGADGDDALVGAVGQCITFTWLERVLILSVRLEVTDP